MTRLDTRKRFGGARWLKVRPWRWVPFSVRLRWATMRSWVGRKRLVRRGLGLASLALALLVVSASRSSATAAQEQWGTTQEVVVVVQSLGAGDFVERGHVEFRSLPRAVVPVDAIRPSTFRQQPAGNELRIGDVLRGRDLVGTQDVPADHRGIAIALGPESPTFVVGDRAEVFVFGDRFAQRIGGEAQVISGRVIETNEESVIVAVPEDVAHQVAAGLVNGAVVLAKTGP